MQTREYYSVCVQCPIFRGSVTLILACDSHTKKPAQCI